MGAIATAYDKSWNSISFLELSTGDGLQGAALDNIGTTYHIPSGDDNIEIDMGLSSRDFEITVGVEATQLASLESAVGSSGTLVWHRGSWSSVKLRGVGASSKTQGFNAYKVSLKFRKL